MDRLSYLLKASVYVLSFMITFYAMRCINYEKFLKKGHVAEAQILYFLLVTAIAYLAGSFIVVLMNI